MPHHKSAEKRLRQTEKRTAINRARLSRVRTFVKKVESAISSGDKEAAQSAFRVAQPELHRATTKGVLHRNTVARKLSRLAARINAL
ncbi:MAG: 30S ribosomal protein S20 [Alphaproteobacteria bacterium]|jgi:small subunit ribosomal protein S20